EQPMRSEDGVRTASSVVVSLVTVGRRKRPGLRSLKRGPDVEPAPARERIARGSAVTTAAGRILVDGRVLEQRSHLIGRQIRLHRTQQRRGGRNLGGRERRPLGVPVLGRTAIRVTLV